MTQTEDFSGYISSVINSTVVGHGLDLGKKTGLMKIMLDLEVPKTSTEIAIKGNMKERYVREWLNLMVCGKIIEYDKFQQKYFLPEHKKAAFRPGGNSELHFFGSVLTFVAAQSHLEKCFSNDGPKGIPMSIYEGFAFHHHSHESSTITFENVRDILTAFPDLLATLVDGGSIFEAGCGSGILATRLAIGFSKSQVHGVDISVEAIEKAKARAIENTIKNTSFDVADLSDMPQVDSKQYDFAVSHFVIHDVPKASLALKEIYRVIKPGGCYLMVDVNMHSDVADNVNNPSALLCYSASLNFAVPVSLAEEGGEGLGPTWGVEKMQEYFKTAGFEKVHLPCDPCGRNAYVIGFKPKEN